MKLSKLTNSQPSIKLSLEHPFNLYEDNNYMFGLDGFYSDSFI